MGGKVFIAPSILSADFSRLGEDVMRVAQAGADWLHVDVMDGRFVPNITIGPCVVKAIRGITKIPFDVHLMIEKPREYVKAFANAGADLITFHIEACDDPARTVEAIKIAGKKAGVSLKPGTDVKKLEPLLNTVDLVLVMTVEPGFGGQSYIPSMLSKIRFLKDNFKGHVQVDGGINAVTAREVVSAGADVLVAGTAIFGERDYYQAIRRLRGE